MNETDGDRLDEVDYDGLPRHMRPAARRYVEDGAIPGKFLQAVLQNDLVEAFGKTDGINEARMKDWTLWLYNECPALAWGSKEKMVAWSDRRKKHGKEK